MLPLRQSKLTQNTNISNNATAIADKLDKGTSTYADAQDIQDAIEGIVVPNVDDFVTETELNTALCRQVRRATHSHPDLAADDHDLSGIYAEVPHNHDGDLIRPNRATTLQLTNL